ncbi:MAG: pseudouridine-5'-phosphate glycosidase [Phycisphaerae bacterium]|nr:MAG: pseudouridine-5'-phosphate glycosidase [Phycisphaerae bacterium]
MLVRRIGPNPVALESTLLLHGVPRGDAPGLAADLDAVIRARGATPALVAVVAGVPTVGVTGAELAALLAASDVPKANTSNLGLLMHRRAHAATTVSATMELAAMAGVRVFATGGLGGVHRGLTARPDISADLGAFTRFPVAVVCAGVKGLLDVEGTRELLESLGVCVIGFGSDQFPAFYRRASAARVDVRIDDVGELAGFVRAELARTGRGIVVANPIPPEHEIAEADWNRWLAEANVGLKSDGRDATPALLARLHMVSGGATLRANLALVRANADLAARLAAHLGE